MAKGEDDRLQLSDVVVLDLQYGVFVDTPLVSAITPSPRAGHSACLLGDSISIFVGFGIGAGRWCRDYWLLCTETLTWMKLKPKSTSSRPPARAYATTTTVAGEIFVFGGNDNNKSLNDIIIGRVQKKKNGSGASITWREPLVLGNVAPAPRTGHCATVSADGNLLVYGGWDDLGAQRLFFSDGKWICYSRRRRTCTALFHGTISHIIYATYMFHVALSSTCSLGVCKGKRSRVSMEKNPLRGTRQPYDTARRALRCRDV